MVISLLVFTSEWLRSIHFAHAKTELVKGMLRFQLVNFEANERWTGEETCQEYSLSRIVHEVRTCACVIACVRVCVFVCVCACLCACVCVFLTLKTVPYRSQHFANSGRSQDAHRTTTPRRLTHTQLTHTHSLRCRVREGALIKISQIHAHTRTHTHARISAALGSTKFCSIGTFSRDWCKFPRAV